MTIPQLLYVLVGGILLGSVSLAALIGLGRAAQRACGVQRETTMALLSLSGMIAMVTAKFHHQPWLASLGAFFCGWIVLFPVLITGMLIWHVAQRLRSLCRRLLRRSE